MATSKPKKTKIVIEAAPAAVTDETNVEPPARVSRHIQPVGPRVLVRILKGPDRSESGLFLPQGAKEAATSALLGEVVEVARTLPKSEVSTDEGRQISRRSRSSDDDDDLDDDDAFGENVSGIPLGANILFGKERGIAVPWDDSLRLLDVRYVLAIVDIIPEEDLQ